MKIHIICSFLASSENEIHFTCLDPLFTHKKKPHRHAAFVKNQLGSVTPKENELNMFILKQESEHR